MRGEFQVILVLVLVSLNYFTVCFNEKKTLKKPLKFNEKFSGDPSGKF